MLRRRDCERLSGVVRVGAILGRISQTSSGKPCFEQRRLRRRRSVKCFKHVLKALTAS